MGANRGCRFLTIHRIVTTLLIVAVIALCFIYPLSWVTDDPDVMGPGYFGGLVICTGVLIPYIASLLSMSEFVRYAIIRRYNPVICAPAGTEVICLSAISAAIGVAVTVLYILLFTNSLPLEPPAEQMITKIVLLVAPIIQYILLLSCRLLSGYHRRLNKD